MWAAHFGPLNRTAHIVTSNQANLVDMMLVIVYLGQDLIGPKGPILIQLLTLVIVFDREINSAYLRVRPQDYSTI